MDLDRRVSRKTLSSQLEEALRDDIIQGRFTPGQRLPASDLGSRYGVSATPLREAFQRLAAEGLIEWDARLGATVAAVSAPELRDIYWLRHLLEPIALRRSIERGDGAWEQAVTDAWAQLKGATRPGTAGPSVDGREWYQAHRDFHEALFSACESPWLLRFVGILGNHSERYRVVSTRVGTRDSTEEHEQIKDAALARDAERAAGALQAHLAATVSVVDNALGSADKSASTSGGGHDGLRAD